MDKEGRICRLDREKSDYFEARTKEYIRRTETGKSADPKDPMGTGADSKTARSGGRTVCADETGTGGFGCVAGFHQPKYGMFQRSTQV